MSSGFVGKGWNKESVLGHFVVGRELSVAFSGSGRGKSYSYLSCHHFPCAPTVHDPRGNQCHTRQYVGNMEVATHFNLPQTLQAALWPPLVRPVISCLCDEVLQILRFVLPCAADTGPEEIKEWFDEWGNAERLSGHHPLMGSDFIQTEFCGGGQGKQELRGSLPERVWCCTVRRFRLYYIETTPCSPSSGIPTHFSKRDV